MAGLKNDEQNPAAPVTQSSSLSAWDRKLVLSFGTRNPVGSSHLKTDKIDGGGIRGLSSLYIMEELMNKIAEIELSSLSPAEHSFHPDPFIPPRPHDDDDGQAEEPSYRYLPCHYFDLIAGTSTGGLIAIMLGRLRMCVRDCIVEYKALGEQVFGHPRKRHILGKKRYLQWNPKKDRFSTGPLRSAVTSVIERYNPFAGEKTAARELLPSLETPVGLCHTFVIATEGTSNKRGYRFRSWPCSNMKSYLQQNQHTHTTAIFRVALATTAAPFYFKPYRFDGLRFYDGGLSSINPCKDGLDDLQLFFGVEKVNHGLFSGAISIGTGKVPTPNVKKKKKFALFRYREACDYVLRQATNPIEQHQAMQEYEDVLNQTMQDTNCGYTFRYSRFTVGVQGETEGDYFGLADEAAKPDVRLMEHMKLDAWDQGQVVTKIERATRAYLQDKKIQDQLFDFAQILVNHRRERSLGDIAECERDTGSINAWYRYASARTWKCQRGTCRVREKSWVAMKAHMETTHRETLRINVNAVRELCSFNDSPRF